MELLEYLQAAVAVEHIVMLTHLIKHLEEQVVVEEELMHKKLQMVITTPHPILTQLTEQAAVAEVLVKTQTEVVVETQPVMVVTEL